MVKLFGKGRNLEAVKLVEKGELKAVHDDDVVDFLKSLNCYEDIISGKIHCFNCKNVITLENFQCVFPLDRKISFCCSDDECYKVVLYRGKVNV